MQSRRDVAEALNRNNEERLEAFLTASLKFCGAKCRPRGFEHATLKFVHEILV